ncbi:MAG: glycosyltransferase family 2 protein [Candidatus Delongbacteria bacterium]
MMDTTTDYSIVVPVYRSTDSLKEIAERYKSVFETKIKKRFELIYVDDSGSFDKSWKMITELSKEYDFVKGMKLSRNFGQHSATVAGFKLCSGKKICTVDDDLQQSPEDIVKLIEKQDHDIVIAEYPTKKHSLFKRSISRIAGYFDHLILGKPAHIRLSSYRLLDRYLVDEMLRQNIVYPFLPALMFGISKDVINVKVEHHERKYGDTSYTLKKLYSLFSNLIFNNSSILLRVLGRLGAFTFLISLIYGGSVLYRKVNDSIEVQGWTTVVILISLFGGIILFAIGVLGEYLIRIINTSEHRPSFIIKDKTGF